MVIEPQLDQSPLRWMTWSIALAFDGEFIKEYTRREITKFQGREELYGVISSCIAYMYRIHDHRGIFLKRYLIVLS